MADRYWVGGTGSWNGTAGTKWSATSGGAGGASVPTSADDVFFDAASGVSTVSIDAGNLGARSINCTGFTGTISVGAAITVAGSITLVTAMTWSTPSDQLITITGTGTLTTAGKTFNRFTINGAGIVVELGGPLTVGNVLSPSIVLARGTFNTNNHNINLTATSASAGLNLSGTLTRAINLGSSTVTIACTGNGALPILTADITNLTFNAGTSTIVLTGSTTGTAGAFNGGGLTFNNVSFTNINTTDAAYIISGNSTFNNMSFTGPASAGVRYVRLSGTQTITGTLSTTDTAGNRRIWFRSADYGISRSCFIVNGSVSLSDADFRDVIVTGTAAPISGTRIGDLRGNSGITFSSPKTVFRIGTGNWSDNQWSATSGGAASTDNFPLAQDTAVFNNSTTTGTHTMDSAIPYCGTVDMSARTSALTLAIGAAQTVYGNWINGSGITLSGGQILTFSGRNAQTVTGASKTFSCPITVDSYGGTVTLADALNIGSNSFTVTNGTFDTGGFALTAGVLSSTNSNVRSIFLGSSTVTLSGAAPIDFSTSTNLVFDAGTSTIISSAGGATFSGAGLTYNNFSFTDTGTSNPSISGVNAFNNITLSSIASTGIRSLIINANQTITGTLTISGGSAIRRHFIRSGTLGTPVTLTVGTLVATDCDFRDITIAGAAVGSSPTRAGDCGGNSGITFPATKTVYWNLTGTQNWSATGWATASGGTPAVNNFPLAQDTAVFDDAGAATTVTVNTDWNIGAVNSGSRTTAMTLNYGGNVYGSWTTGTGVTLGSGLSMVFLGRGTTTITSNGRTFAGNPIRIDCVTGTVQLADAFVFNGNLTVTTGTLNAATFNVTVGAFTSNSGSTRSVRMGSGTWTLTSNATVWDLASITGLTFDKGTANIVLSDTSTTARTFAGAGFAYNKLTIGGTTGISTTTITGNNIFNELASTKTVAHTIALGTTAQTFGAWTVTGTVGNVVTLTGTGTSHTIVGAATSGIDYLAMGSIGFSTVSPGEFYAGANSTGTAVSPVFRTAPPAARTLYWVGGTGNWSSTARWSLASGGAGGQAIPTSLDNVIFDSASNATAYTATIDVTARCNQLTIAGPASGNLTLAGTSALILHGNTSFPTTGFTRSFTSPITLSGSATGKTFTGNIGFGNSLEVNGVGAGWSLLTALNIGTSSIFSITNGTFDTGNFNVTCGQLTLGSVGGVRTLNLGSSTVTLASTTPLTFSSLAGNAPLFTFNAGTSQITINTVSGVTFTGGGYTFNNVSFTGSAGSPHNINSNNTFNNLSFTALSATGLRLINMFGDQVITGTLTLSAGSDATRRSFIRSNAIGTTRTLTVAAFSGTDVDFRDITIAGAAAPISGTRLGDCKGNSGITFGAGVTRYWNLAGGGNWSATAWADTGGGTPVANNFPLAQDTCVFQATGLNSGATVTVNTFWNIGTIDMSDRTANTMTFATGVIQPLIHGNWINGTGTTISGTSSIILAGRSSQTITSAGRSFTQSLQILSLSGSVTLQDALTISGVLNLTAGTLNLNGFNTTASSISSGSATYTRTLVVGTNTTMTLTGTSPGDFFSTALTVTGSGTFRCTSASAKTFAGGTGAGMDFSAFTLDQAGAGNLTVTGNNRFKDITATQTATGTATISLGTTTQRLTQFTGKGEAGRILTLQGTSAASPATLVYTGFGPATTSVVDYLNIIGIRAYTLTNTWYAGNNSTNGGTLGWIFEQTPAVLPGNGNFFLMFI